MSIPTARLMLMLGSGVSLPTGLPSTEKLTQAVLEEAWHSHTDGQYYPGPEPNAAFVERNTVLRIQPFLRRLKTAADAYFSGNRLPFSHYEDIYFLAWQLAEEASRSRLNPAIAPFFKEIELLCSDLVRPLPLTDEEFTFERLTSEARGFIECVVRQEVWTRDPPTGLNLIVDLARQFATRGLTIATLNHDTLIEQALSDASVGFEDGFLPPDGDLSFFDPSVLDAADKIRLLKLHGSYNWRWARVDENGIYRDCWIKVVRGEPLFRKTTSGIRIEHETPAGILVGTLNKLYDYHFGIVNELLIRFHTILSTTDAIIISGYGWGDFAINGWLKNWMLEGQGHRIILLHTNPEEALRNRAGSGVFPEEYDAWVRDGRLFPIRKWLCDTAIEELLPLMGSVS